LATKNHAVTLSLPPSPAQCDGEENQKEKAKLMGCDRNSLTEQQRKKKITTIILIKNNIQHATFSPLNTQLAPE